MITILLDSSNRELAVGLAKDNKLIAETSYEAWQRQSEAMVFELDKLLKQNNVDKKDISGIVVAIGPGSYTGVRIALTIAKVMSMALNAPLYPISSLRVMKINSTPTIALINARGQRSYIGVYQNEKIILEEQIMKNEEVLEYVNKHPNYTISGDTEYLRIQSQKPHILKEMLDLMPFLHPYKEPLGLNPRYLKD